MRKLAFIFSLLLLPCILFGQESSGIDTTHIDIYHFPDIMTTYGKDEYLGWVRSLIGKSEEELEANIKGAEMYPISLRAGTSCKVFYTESDYIEISFDHHLSPFTAILIRHGSGWGGRDGEWQKVNDDPLHHFYETTHLSALEAIPTKAEIIVEMSQTLPSQ